MIKKLTRVGLWTELVDKINEVIDAVNDLNAHAAEHTHEDDNRQE